VTKRLWRFNSRPRLSELRDALGCRDRPSLEMHLEAEMNSTLRHTRRPGSIQVGDENCSQNRASLEMQLEPEIEYAQGCTGGCNQASLEINL